MSWLELSYIAAMITVAFGVAAMFVYAAILLRSARSYALEPAETQLWTYGDLLRVAVFYVGVLGLASLSGRVLAPKNMPENASKVADMLSLTFAHVVVCFYVVLLGELRRGKRLKDFGLSQENAVHNVVWGVALYACFCPLLMGAVKLIRVVAVKIGERLDDQAVVDMVAQETSLGLLATVAAIVIVAAPITEELLFRGFLFSALRENVGPRRAMFLSAAMFSVLHVSALAVLPIFLLGLLLAWAFHRTKTLAAPIAIHMTHNAITVFFLLRSRG